MENSNEYRQIVQTLEAIHHEVKENERKLRIGREEVRKVINLIPRKEQIVSELKNRLDELKEINYEKQSIKNQLITEKIQIANQITKIAELTEIFSSQNSFHGNAIFDANKSIPRDIQNRIDIKIDELIQTLCSEYSQSSENYSQQLFELHKINESLSREIEILQLLNAKKFKPPNNFDIYLDEFCQRYVPENQNGFQSFQEIPIIKNSYRNNSSADEQNKIELDQVLTEFPEHEQINLEDVQNQMVSFIKKYKQQNGFIKSSYYSQVEFLNQITGILKSRTNEDDTISSIEDRLQHQLKLMRDVGECEEPCCKPLQIPETQRDECQIKPLTDVLSHFDIFCKQVDEIMEKRRLDSAVSIDIPPFGISRMPKHIRNFKPSEDLVKFADNMKELIESTKKMIPLQAMQAITSTHREFLNQTDEYYPQNIPNEIPIPQMTSIVDKVDLSSLDYFQETVNRKLPSLFTNNSNGKRYYLEVPEVTEEVFHEKFEDVVIDSKLEARVEYTNALLRSLVNTINDPVPTFDLPDLINDNSQKFSNETLIHNVNEVLSPKQQTIQFLNDEIQKITNKIKEIDQQLQTDDEITAEGESLLLLIRKNEEIESENKKLDEKINSFVNEIKSLKLEKAKIDSENVILRQEISEFTVDEEMIEQKEKELEDKMSKLKEKKENWEEELELRRQLQGSLND
ncbi:hypothetical protein TRFO_18377 [Tritrichomonas foetus]|uniref:Uncharacterized protein n=1 Tax=Tritrichomonas foetus TaxID=1144522 RepID=A0A1J4KM29_9EUKA|nr:hypothetical protein TRFO_18377 [Tritrichomonas foetus]|eukprot:OHT11992.1 hypothetical protein TRFO_18377 [Tritrichomonas foetus]